MRLESEHQYRDNLMYQKNRLMSDLLTGKVPVNFAPNAMGDIA